MPKYQFPQKIKQACIQGMRDCGDVIFKDSQQFVPVDKGFLRRSGRIKKITNGVQITYRTNYAAAVEFGFPRHSERVRRHFVRAHFRKFRHYYSIFNVKTGRRTTHVLGPIKYQNGIATRAIVPVHIKKRMKYKIFVAAHMRGPFTRPDVVGRVGKGYLRNAVDNHYPDLPKFIHNALLRMP